MKTRTLLLLGILLTPFSMAAQSNPPPAAAYISSGGNWIGAPTTNTSGAISMPPPVALYCLNGSGQWVPATSACFGGGGGSVTWPATNDLVLSNSTNSPAGLAPVNGDCVLGAGGVWTAGACGSVPFPLALQATESYTLPISGPNLVSGGDTWFLGSGWSGDYGSGFVGTAASGNLIDETFVPTIGQSYLVTWTTSGHTDGELTFTLGGVANRNGDVAIMDGGTADIVLTATSTGPLTITPDDPWTGTASNIQVYLYTGAPVAASYALNDFQGNPAAGLTASLANLQNTFIGVGVGAYNYGYGNVGVGNYVLGLNTYGYLNTVVGFDAYANNLIGYGNTVLGAYAMNQNQNGTGYYESSTWNVAVGAYALYNLDGVTSDPGVGNVAVGANALDTPGTGGSNNSSFNVALGQGAGGSCAQVPSYQVSYDIFIGGCTSGSGAADNYEIVIGADSPGVEGYGSNTTTIGNSRTTTSYINGSLADNVATTTNNDTRGSLTLSTGTVSYTFTAGPAANSPSGSWSTPPLCTVQDLTFANQATTTLTVSTTTLTIGNSVGTADTYTYHCDLGN